MSLINHVLKPAGFPQLLRKIQSLREAEPARVPAPSLASVEYELMQLRASLLGVVDFKEDLAPTLLAGHPVIAKPLPAKRRISKA